MNRYLNCLAIATVVLLCSGLSAEAQGTAPQNRRARQNSGNQFRRGRNSGNQRTGSNQRSQRGRQGSGGPLGDLRDLLNRRGRRGGNGRGDQGQPQPQPQPQPQTLYDVTLRHPVTGAILDSRVVPVSGVAEARAALGTPHWRVWKYAGVNEPTNFQRFESAAEAQSFQIPVKLFGIVPFAIESQSVEAGRVSAKAIRNRRRPSASR